MMGWVINNNRQNSQNYVRGPTGWAVFYSPLTKTRPPGKICRRTFGACKFVCLMIWQGDLLLDFVEMHDKSPR